MSIEISNETAARLAEEARKQGISVEALLERLMTESVRAASVEANGVNAKLPTLHLGPMGSLHRRDIYDDVG